MEAEPSPLKACLDVQGLSQCPQARLEDSLRLLGALRPFGGSLCSVILTGLSEERTLRAERLNKVYEAMKADERIAPTAWDLGPWRQLLRLYGRWGHPLQFCNAEQPLSALQKSRRGRRTLVPPAQPLLE